MPPIAAALVALGACLGGCGERSNEHAPAAHQQPPRSPAPDLVLLMVDGGTSHPEHFRLPRPSLAVFEDGTVIRSTSFPKSSDKFQTLRVDPQVVSAISWNFQKLEASARGQHFTGPDMAVLDISGRVAPAPTGWASTAFVMTDATDPSRSGVVPHQILSMRQLLREVNSLNWSEAVDSSRDDAARVAHLR